ncbi:gluconokinase [Alphaproteobacteria bacterium]|nr:gluconokinase [Alphaproteobacteria bacterium]
MVAVVVMGVCGCGKSTLAITLAKELNGVFIEGDNLHPEANVAKMASGSALSDEDRWPWLTTVGASLSGNEVTVAACSALKKVYRDRIRETAGRDVQFIFLNGERPLIESRMSEREGHYMPTRLIESQFAILEDPTEEADVLSISIDDTPVNITQQALNWLEKTDD